MTDHTEAKNQPPKGEQLVIEPRFTGKSYVAVLRVLVAGESVLMHKVDLAKEGTRQEFVGKVAKRLPGVEAAEVEAKLLKLCDDRTAWLEAADQAAAQGSEEPTLADLMAQIACGEAELFHDKSKVAYASIQVENHTETWAVKSKGFRLWLRRRLREEHNRSAGCDAVNTALEEIESKALFDGETTDVYVRVAERGGEVWLDLCNDTWEAVRITSASWEIVGSKMPVRFVRAKGMLPLDTPLRGGSVNGLRQFLNVHDESDFVLLVAWLLAGLRQSGPFPVLNITGEQGSAKSTTQKLLRSLVDPNSAPLRCEPRESRDLMISAANSWIVAFDNLSSIRSWLSEALCRLSTGGGFATRELYANSEEIIFDCQRPVMLNGITDVANRSDLLDRSLLVTLAAIPEDQRRPEKGLWAAFAAARAKILGALLDAVVAGLAGEASVKLDRLPRMADFAIWVTACERALGWTAGTFMGAYSENRSSANETAVEASIVGTMLMQFMAERPTWEGTCADLLAALEGVAGEKMASRQDWPKTSRKLSGDLRRIAPNLRRVGLDLWFDRSGGKDRRRLIHLVKTDGAAQVTPTEAQDRPTCNSPEQLPVTDAPDGSDSIVPRIEDLADDARHDWEERVSICVAEGLTEAEAHEVAWKQIKDREAGSPVATALQET